MTNLITGFKRYVKQIILSTWFTGRITNDSFVRHLMEEFHADEYGHQSSIGRADLGYGWIHYGILRNLKPSRILCIGSRHGYIPAVLTQACKENGKGHVDFVDAGYGSEDKNHWTGVGYWKTQQGKFCFEKFGLNRYITIHIMTTAEFSRLKSENKENYDYIYIDGDHSYAGVTKDYQLFWPHLNNNGFMVFHDVSVTKLQPEGKYGVHDLWKRLRLKNAITFAFEGSGLGVLQKD